MEFKDKLKELRNKHNLTQENLSNVLHVSRSLVAKWENGLGLPSKETITEICNYFNVTEEELFAKNDSINVIVDKNIKIKKKNLIIIILTTILSLFIIYALIYIVIEQANNYKINKEAKHIESLIETEEITILDLKLDINSYVYDSYNDDIYALNYATLDIIINMNKELYSHINIGNSKIKLSIYDEYVQLYNSLDPRINGFNVSLIVDDYNCLCDIYVEEIILEYGYNIFSNNFIYTESKTKNYIFDSNLKNSISVYFVEDFNILVDVYILDEYLITIDSLMGMSAFYVLNDTALKLLIEYKIKELEEKYLINFDHFEYKFNNDNLNSLRYVDYKINIIPKLENDIDLKFSKNIYDLSFKKDELLELDVYLNGNKCYLYDMNIFDKTGNISGYINNDGKIVLSAVNTGNYEIELSLNIGFKQIIYIINVNIE